MDMDSMPPSTRESRCHILAVPHTTWGHTRPFSALVARIVQARPMVVTYFVPQSLYHRIDTELKRGFEPEDLHLKDRIRLIAVPVDLTDTVVGVVAFFEMVAQAYGTIVRGGPITCVETETSYVIGEPDAMLMDGFAFRIYPALKLASPKHLKTYCFVPWAGTSEYPWFVHRWESELNEGDLVDRLLRDAAARMQPITEYTNEKFHTVRGEVIEVPGMPPMYDHEWYLQKAVDDMEHINGMITANLLGAHNQCDGLITASPACLESPSVMRALTDWMMGRSKEIFQLGPLLTLTRHSYEVEKTLTLDSGKIDEFMDQVLRLRGPRSMIFISFGSNFWPADPSKLWVVLEVLREKDIPFILSHGAKGGTVPDGIVESIRSSGNGLITPWAPQQTILAHPAIGWFISHAGFGGMIESIAAGVPIIAWPFILDQPVNTIYMTDHLRIAYELIEIRTGEHATKPISRTGKVPTGTLEAVRAEIADVLEKAFGADGEEKRTRVLKLREKVLAAWGLEGSAKRDLERLLDSLGA